MNKLAELKTLTELVDAKKDRLSAIYNRLQVIKAKANATEDISSLEAELAELGSEVRVATAEVADLVSRVKALKADIYHSPFTARG